MPRKKVNWELKWFKIHNPPEQFYFEFGKTVLFSNNLFQTPTVTTNSVLSTKVVEKYLIGRVLIKFQRKATLNGLILLNRSLTF